MWVGGFATKEEAAKQLKIKEAEILKEEYVRECNGSFRDCADILIRDYLDLDLKISTIRMYRYAVSLANQVFGDKPMKKVNIDDIIHLNAFLFKQKFKQSSISTIHTKIKTLFSKAVLYEKIKCNPYNKFKIKKIPKHETYIPSVEEMHHILELSKKKGREFYLMILLGVGMGLRRGEILGIQFNDFTSDSSTLHIQRQLVYHKDSQEENSKCVLELSTLKTEGSNRILFVPDTIAQLIEEIEHDTKIACLKQGISFKKEYLLFHNKNDVTKPFRSTVVWLYCVFNRMLKSNGLPHMRIHDLRHVYATYCLNEGISLKTISYLLGHTNITTTANIYCSVTTEKENAKQVASKLISI